MGKSNSNEQFSSCATRFVHLDEMELYTAHIPINTHHPANCVEKLNRAEELRRKKKKKKEIIALIFKDLVSYSLFIPKLIPSVVY